MVGPDSSLGDLLRQSDWGDVDTDTFLSDFAALVAHEVSCSYAGIRLLVVTASAQKVLRTIVLHDRSQATTLAPPDLADAGIEVYLNAVARGGGLVASDAESDLRVPKSLRAQLAMRGAHSLLEVAISVNGPVYGTLSCEQTGKNVQWTPRQVDTLRRLAIRVAPTVVRVARDELAASAVRMQPAANTTLALGHLTEPVSTRSPRGDTDAGVN